jgi:hypothetical protein
VTAWWACARYATGDLVNLGSIREMLYRHDVRRVCEISPLLDRHIMDFFRVPGSPSISSLASTMLGEGFEFRIGDRDDLLCLSGLP